MKKLIILFVTLILALSMMACGSESTEPEPVQENFEVPTGAFNERDMIFVLNGTPYPISTDSSPLLKAFGGEYEEIAAPSCAFVGEDKQFIFNDATVYTYPDGDIDLINEIYIYGGSYTTSRGIGLGNSIDQVKSVYGEGGFEQGSNYVYVVSGAIDDTTSPRLTFEATDGIIDGISFFGANGVIQ